MDHILHLLDQLAALHATYDQTLAAKTAAVPAWLRKRVAACEAPYIDTLSQQGDAIERVEADVRAAVLEHGASVKGQALHAVFLAGRATWNDASLQGYATVHPELLAFRSLGKPSVSLRKVG